MVSIKDAETFFQTIQRNVESLEEFSRPHPLSTDAAVASLKRYLSEPRYRIQLADLIDETVERVIEATSTEAFAVQGGPGPDRQSATARVRGYEATCSTLLTMAPIGGFWAEEDHYQVWQRALARLSVTRGGGGYVLWLDLQRYPGTLLLYALGLGAVEGSRLNFLGRLFATTVHRENREDVTAVQLLPPSCLSEQGGQVLRLLEGMDRRYAPLNDWLHAALLPFTKRLISSQDRYTLLFDKLEMLMALSYAYHDKRTKDYYWAPPGAFGYRHESRNRVIREIEESMSKLKGDSPFVRSGIFGETVDVCMEAFAWFKEFVGKVGRSWY